jgi:hypothetical protein
VEHGHGPALVDLAEAAKPSIRNKGCTVRGSAALS